MSIMKLGTLMIALSAFLVVAPSVGHARMNGLPPRLQIGFSVQPGGNRLTDAVSPIYLAGLVGRQTPVSAKPAARSRLATLFDALFGRRNNVSRPKASANIFVRRPKLESKGPELQETLVAQPTVDPNERALSFIAPAAPPTVVSSQSLPIAPIPAPNLGASKINDLPALPLE